MISRHAPNAPSVAAPAAATAPDLRSFDRIIMGVDPGTNLMGYALLGITARKPVMIAMGVIRLSRFESHYKRLSRIFARVLSLVEEFLPDEMAIEAPFFGKNVQSMLKLGRAQGVAMAAALSRDIPITEYEPSKIKIAVTGNGAASKEQVAEMLRRILSLSPQQAPETLDASDALAAALCHFYQSAAPGSTASHASARSGAKASSWKDFVAQNPSRVK